MSRVRARRLAVGLVVVTALAAAAEAALRLPELAALDRRFDDFPVFPVITLSAVLAAVVGAVVVDREPRNPVGWLFVAGNCLVELGLVGSAWTERSALSPTPFPGAGWAAWVEDLSSVDFALGNLVLLVLLFPTGRLPSRRWRPLAWCSVAALLYVEVLTAQIVGLPWEATPAQELHLDHLRTVLFVIGQLALFACLLGAVAALAVRRRRAVGNERQQLRLFVLAAGAVAATLVLLALDGPLLGIGLPRLVPEALFYVAYGALPVAAGLAMLRYRLYDVDLLLVKAVVVATLSAVSTAGYVAVVVTLGALLGPRVGGGLPVSLLTTAGVAVAVQPLRRTAVRLADRLVHGERATPYEVLAGFARRLGDAMAVDEVLPRMARAAAQAAGACAVTARLLLPGSADRTVHWPDEDPPEGAEDLVVPVEHAGEPVGELSLWLHPGEHLDAAARQLLDDLAGQAGLALHNVRLTAELQDRLRELSVRTEELAASRRRLLVAGTGERRRFAQQIGEQVRPHVEALSDGLEQVERRLAGGQDAGVVAADVARLAQEATAALDALRDIARGIFPPLLADHGLLAGLEGLARRPGSGLTVSAPDGLPRFPAAVEAPAYFCCSRAAALAAHTGVAVHVVLSADAEGLVLDLSGPVLDEDTLAGLLDRVAGSGGALLPLVGGPGTALRLTLPGRPLAAPVPA